jgi:FkbM family methyltransferase
LNSIASAQIPIGAIAIARRALAYVRQKKIERLGQRPSWQWLPRGFEMNIDPSQPNDIAYLLGVFERAPICILTRVVRPGDICLDLGANKGYFTLTLARAVGPAGAVISVDPDPPIFRELCANCERNRFSWVKTFNCALGDAAGTCQFSLNLVIGNSSRFPNEIANQAVHSTINVEVRTVDSILQDIGPPAAQRLSFVKLDVEGSEPLVLRGMRHTLSHCRPAIYLEVNLGSLAAGGMNPGNLEDVLLPFGYRFWEIQWLRKGLVGRVALTQESSFRHPSSALYRDMLALVPGSPAWESCERLF